jgi:multidrug efflux pump subunit AcrA (membrane-fusion protein)
MSWIERAVEERLARAAADGDLDAPTLQGQPLDLDTQRPQGWWAERFVERELSHDRRQVAESAAAAARAGFWRAATVDELRERVAAANAAIERANVNLIAGDRLAPFDPADIERRWRRLRRS